MNQKYLLPILSLLILLSGCNRFNKKEEAPLFELLSSTHTGINFDNRLVEDDSLNILAFDYMYNGGGVAVGDFNNDSLPDIFFTGNKVSCRLYLNKGQMQFEDVTEKAGLTTTQWSEGVTLVDINNDGLLDVYVSTSSNYSHKPSVNMLFENKGIDPKGIPVFAEKAAAYGIADTGYNTQAAFFDYNKDGHLDLYVLSNAIESFNRNQTRRKELTGKGKSTDKLYRNNGDGTFSNVSRESGIVVEGYGLGLAISDINGDGWPDVYAANDFISNDIMYINNGDGTFSNKIAQTLKHQSMFGMGTDVADYNNDGLMDIVVVDMMPDKNLRQKTMFPNINYDRYMLNLNMGYEPQFIRNTLQLNKGRGPGGEPVFSEIGQLAGIYKTDWSWSPLFADFDNDGLKDLFISNGYGKDVTDLDFIMYANARQQFGTKETKEKARKSVADSLPEVRMPNFIYKNNGDLTFSDKSYDWGFRHASLSNGTAYADLDMDGDLDLVINNLNDGAFIYQNNLDKRQEPANFLKIRLKGDSLNIHGLGSRVRLTYKKGNGWESQYYEHYLTRGYKSTVDNTIHFGLQALTQIDTLEIIWPDGKRERLSQVPTNKLLTLDYKNARQVESPEGPENIQVPDLVFEEVTALKNINYQHKAQDFVDFKFQALLPHKHSENGPGIAVEDVNADGLDDFYVGGSPDAPGELYVQLPDGTFKGSILQEDARFDDMGSLFFDADGDGDADLYVVSGGSRHGASSRAYQDRLYLNDGRGNFSYQPDALPKMWSSGAVVTAADFDQDGDLDLFVGGRIVPGRYPLPAQSYILRNDAGVFTDITEALCPEMQNLGLVSSAIWSDFNQDGQIDLLVTGEWMPLSFFQQEKADDGSIYFEDVTESAGMAASTGWWNSIVSGDFNQDGHMDYVAGNLGLNSNYKTSSEEPLSIYAKDFDGSGTIDPIMFHYLEEKKHPVHPRDALINQITYMRGRFREYSIYGKTTFDQFFTKEELQDVYMRKAEHFSTSWVENLGDGQFKLHALPNEAQFAPTNGILARDINADGHLDLLLVGNSYATEVLSGRYDAATGNYLEGDGKGNFKPIGLEKSHFLVDGDARAIVCLKGKENETLYIVSRNKGSLSVLRQKNRQNLLAFTPEPLDQRAEIHLKNGSTYTHEFHYGSSYLSHPARTLPLNDEVAFIMVYDYAGNSRKHEFSVESNMLP